MKPKLHLLPNLFWAPVATYEKFGETGKKKKMAKVESKNNFGPTNIYYIFLTNLGKGSLNIATFNILEKY